jgi:ABC-2 type transport system permease protein
MAEQTTPGGLRTGIYDLGYRSYDGQRLGRAYAVWSLFTYSFRTVFGLGRSWVSKLFSMGLAVILLLPALVLLGVAAITPEDFELELNYFDFIGFGYVGTVLALFGAVTAPELVGRDQRHHTLALYFSRSLSRTDYVTAKVVALTLSVFLVVAAPQIVLLVGNAVSTETIVDYLSDNLSELPPIFASSLLIGGVVTSITLAIACQTPRRAWATGAVIIFFVMTTALGAILLETVSSKDAGYVLMVSPVAMLQGASYWLFGDTPPVSSDVYRADLDGSVYLLTALAYALVGLVVLYRRFWRLTA